MKIFKYSNIGNREQNQDYLVSTKLGQDSSLHLVADGMGGYDCGDIASKIVGDSYVYGLSRNMSIEDATREASNNIQIERRNLGVAKIGSTVAGVLICGMKATIFWAGDSRVYLFRNKEQLFQTEDHSILNELSRKRKLSFEERERYGHIITRSIMGNPDDKVDTCEMTLQEGDELLICSDGLYNDCPIDYLIDTLREDRFDIDKQNDGFTDNHSLIYISL
ncbi:PP2C family protein-serine/threonine phosphatase [Prevotella denticola]|uniref:PP2C family protein-serine/threonine phosphatase n=2 Tax=Prevotella denticola TaxID=28129 RepID=UPI001BAD3956|nr:protein phosphatase 2C domain-containing protein [Prevotella denticola]QUB89948.1 serine/threonine-protein phosphatase [Prevotella denticola]